MRDSNHSSQHEVCKKASINHTQLHQDLTPFARHPSGNSNKPLSTFDINSCSHHCILDAGLISFLRNLQERQCILGRGWGNAFLGKHYSLEVTILSQGSRQPCEFNSDLGKPFFSVLGDSSFVQCFPTKFSSLVFCC